jgi:hypothetical protein
VNGGVTIRKEVVANDEAEPQIDAEYIGSRNAFVIASASEGPSPMVIDHGPQIDVRTPVVRSLAVFATRDDRL